MLQVIIWTGDSGSDTGGVSGVPCHMVTGHSQLPRLSLYRVKTGINMVFLTLTLHWTLGCFISLSDVADDDLDRDDDIGYTLHLRC